MYLIGVGVITFFVSQSLCVDYHKFPDGFLFGVASSAYQVEGAWNVSDILTRTQKSLNGSNGDVACDSYRLWKRDVEIAKEMGLNHYRFSISWSRLLPTGFPNNISEDGKNYYNNLIDELLANGIQPLVTIYHWDLPQGMYELGGWANPLISNWLEDYAKVVFSLYADRVKYFITINEPNVVCDALYNEGTMAPSVSDKQMAAYICTKNVMISHAKVYKLYQRDYKEKYNGKLSMCPDFWWYEPASEQYEDLAELVRQYGWGMYSHPIYSETGGWPPAIVEAIANYSQKIGYPYSRLPAFTDEEKEFVKGTADFYGMNFYTSRLIRTADPGEEIGTWFTDGAPELNAVYEYNTSWPVLAASSMPIDPEGFRKQLVWLKKQYGDIEVFITENGVGTSGSNLHDDDRIDYIKSYLEQLLLAVYEDGVKVIGYTAWSLIDDFEWFSGYTLKFGLYEVNFTSPDLTRSARKSARWYAAVIANGSLDVSVE